MEIVDTIRMTEWKTWFKIQKDFERYNIWLFNEVDEIMLDISFDTLEWAKEYIESIKPKD